MTGATFDQPAFAAAIAAVIEARALSDRQCAVEDAIGYLAWIVHNCRTHPKCTVRVSR